MPTNRRRLRPRRRTNLNALTACQRNELANGWPVHPGGPGFEDLDEMRAAWEMHRDAMIARYVEHLPGRRPFAAWLFDIAPKFGERPIIDPEFTRDQFKQSPASRENRYGVLHTHLWP